jgi:O-antigen/teichoic acid export membrane protein
VNRPPETTSEPDRPFSETHPWWRRGVVIVSGRAGESLLRFGLFLATARILPAGEFAVFALLTAALGTSQSVFALGGPRTAAYFQQPRSRAALCAWLVLLSLLASAAVLFGLAVFRGLRIFFFPTVPAGLVFLGFAPLPFLLLADSLSAILLADRRERLYSLFLWARCLATAIVVVSSLLASRPLVWLLVGRILVNALVVVGLLRAVRTRPSFSELPEFARNASRFAAPIALASGLVALHRRADVFLLSALGRTPEIGGYAVAYALAEAFWIVTDSLETALFVDLAGKTSEIARREALRAARLYALIGLAACAGGLGAGYLILRLLFSARFPSATGLFPWLLLATVVWGTGRPFASYLFSRRLGSSVLWSHAAGLASNVLLCASWIPRQGAAGAAKATLASYLLETLILGVVALRSPGRAEPK